MKRIVIASDSYKGSASSLEVGEAIAAGIREVAPDIETKVLPIADGGEGTVAAALSVPGAQEVRVRVSGPLGDPVQASYALVDEGRTAVIEMAAASGITLTQPSPETVEQASTYGTGELLLDALQRGVQRICIGIGGSATNDGGMGMAAALGVCFYDAAGQMLTPSAHHLSEIAQVDLSGLSSGWKNVTVEILSDVTNPLCGPQGATAVYGPQKGVTPEMIPLLDQGMSHYASIVEQAVGKRVREIPGAGAAGGLGAGLILFVDGQIRSGIDVMMELIGLNEALSSADLVITGEGRMDAQSANGKAPVGIARVAKKYGVPVIAIVGSAEKDLDPVYQAGISGVFPIVRSPMSLEQAISHTQELIKMTSGNLMHFYLRLREEFSK